MYRHFFKGAISANPLFCLHPGTQLTKLLEINTNKYLITKRNSYANCRMRQENNRWLGRRITISLSMEDKMAAGAFGRARNYGRDGHFNISIVFVCLFVCLFVCVSIGGSSSQLHRTSHCNIEKCQSQHRLLQKSNLALVF